MTIGQRIKQRREQLGLTQDELAHKVGYASRSSINKIELSRDLPLRKVSKMATALDTSPSYLMGWTDNPDPDYPIASEKLQAAQEGIDNLVGFKTKKYYLDEETAEVAQSLFENDDMRLLFDAAKDSKPEDLHMVADMLNRLKQTNPEG